VSSDPGSLHEKEPEKTYDGKSLACDPEQRNRCTQNSQSNFMYTVPNEIKVDSIQTVSSAGIANFSLSESAIMKPWTSGLITINTVLVTDRHHSWRLDNKS